MMSFFFSQFCVGLVLVWYYVLKRKSEIRHMLHCVHGSCMVFPVLSSSTNGLLHKDLCSVCGAYMYNTMPMQCLCTTCIQPKAQMES
jgi:hypothetical protein